MHGDIMLLFLDPFVSLFNGMIKVDIMMKMILMLIV